MAIVNKSSGLNPSMENPSVQTKYDLVDPFIMQADEGGSLLGDFDMFLDSLKRTTQAIQLAQEQLLDDNFLNRIHLVYNTTPEFPDQEFVSLVNIIGNDSDDIEKVILQLYANDGKVLTLLQSHNDLISQKAVEELELVLDKFQKDGEAFRTELYHKLLSLDKSAGNKFVNYMHEIRPYEVWTDVLNQQLKQITAALEQSGTKLSTAQQEELKLSTGEHPVVEQETEDFLSPIARAIIDSFDQPKIQSFDDASLSPIIDALRADRFNGNGHFDFDSARGRVVIHSELESNINQGAKAPSRINRLGQYIQELWKKFEGFCYRAHAKTHTDFQEPVSSPIDTTQDVELSELDPSCDFPIVADVSEQIEIEEAIHTQPEEPSVNVDKQTGEVEIIPENTSVSLAPDEKVKEQGCVGDEMTNQCTRGRNGFSSLEIILDTRTTKQSVPLATEVTGSRPFNHPSLSIHRVYEQRASGLMVPKR